MGSHRRIALTLFVMWALSNCRAQSQTLCFAFLVKGDVAATCGGQTTQITQLGDLEGFAVTDRQPSLAYTTSRIVKRSGPTEIGISTTTVVSLDASTVKTFEGVSGVVSSCGGLFPLASRRANPSASDLVSGAELAFPPYVRFRCSADRRTVVGTIKSDGSDLYMGLPPEAKIAPAGNFNSSRFTLSPDGSKVAYYSDLGTLCVFSAPGGTQCVEKQGTETDSPSVNNFGEVLIAKGTGQECFYNGSYNFSPKRFPGATDESRDECLGVGYWKPGLASIQLIDPLGRGPQWISPATAELLRKWSAQQGQKSAK